MNFKPILGNLRAWESFRWDWGDYTCAPPEGCAGVGQGPVTASQGARMRDPLAKLFVESDDLPGFETEDIKALLRDLPN
jgi:hypothetical protein